MLTLHCSMDLETFQKFEFSIDEITRKPQIIQDQVRHRLFQIKQVKESLKVSPELKIEFFTENTYAPINYQDINALIQHNNHKALVTLINPHYSEEFHASGDIVAPKEKFRNPEAYDDIACLLQQNQDDIVHDTVSNKKYKCYFNKCRKTFFTV